MQIIVIFLLYSYCLLLIESGWIQTMISKANTKKSIFQFTEIPYKTHANYSFYQFHDNISNYYNTITRNNHRLCPLYHEEWLCNGSHYEDTLQHTLRFNNIFALDNIYPNSKVFIEANIFFTQVVITWICESLMKKNNNNDILIWKVSSQKRNHLLAYIPDKNIAILHYEYTNRHTTLQITDALTNIGYLPTKIILSGLVSESSSINISPIRYNDYYAFFKTYDFEPDIIYANQFIISDRCSSKYHNCSKASDFKQQDHMSSKSFQCVPGPILRDAEELGKLLLFHTYLTTNTTILFNSTILPHYLISTSSSNHDAEITSARFIYNSSIDWFSTMREISKEHHLFEFEDKIQYLHDPKHPLHDYRMHNASVYEEVVTRNQHHWCALYRDNYCCIGERYEGVLQKTIPLREDFTIDKLAPHTRIYMEGNSHLAEVIQSWICESSYYIQQQQYNNNHNKLIVKDIFNVYQLSNDSAISLGTGTSGQHSSSLFIHLPYHNISIFLLDNYDVFNLDTLKTIAALKTIGYIPTIINIGRFNFERRDRHHTVSNRYNEYVQAFPNTYINAIHEKLPSGCQADFKDCYDNIINGPHQCLPGPTLRYTEFFAEEMIKYSYHYR